MITGTTRLYGVIADPIHHVKTPQVMNDLFAHHQVDGVLVPMHVHPEGLAHVLDGLRAVSNFGGFIATVPHKPAMLGLCDSVTEQARRIGAVNCVRRDPDGRMIGAMLDGIGFVEGLRAAGLDPQGKRAYLAGAGGAASAMAFALADAGVVHLTIANRTLSKAEALVDRLAEFYPTLSLSTDVRSVAAHDLVVNGTSVGMKEGEGAPLDVDQLHADQVVAEAIMQPAMTPLLTAAKACGCKIQPGLPMLQSQIVLMARHMGAIS